MAELGWVGIVVPRVARRRGPRLRRARGGARGARPHARPRALPLDRAARRPGAPRSRATRRRRKEWLPRVVAGDAILALAQQEARSRYDLRRGRDARRARRQRASGSAARRSRCSTATWPTLFVVVARTAGGPRDAEGITLFLVPKGARGLDRHAPDAPRRPERGAGAARRRRGRRRRRARRARRRPRAPLAAWSIAPRSASAPRCWAAWSRPSR